MAYHQILYLLSVKPYTRCLSCYRLEQSFRANFLNYFIEYFTGRLIPHLTPAHIAIPAATIRKEKAFEIES